MEDDSTRSSATLQSVYIKPAWFTFSIIGESIDLPSRCAEMPDGTGDHSAFGLGFDSCVQFLTLTL